MKRISKLLFAAAMVIAVTNPTTTVEAEKMDSLNAMYRMYNPYSGEHFYTADPDERLGLMQYGWDYEGVGWYAPVTSDIPVYRLYNPNQGLHHYTTSLIEKDTLVSYGWIFEKVGWYSNDSNALDAVKIYREYCLTSGQHNYTSSLTEHTVVSSWADWTAENDGLWYGTEPEDETTDLAVFENSILIGDSYGEGFDGYYTHYEEGWCDVLADLLGMEKAYIHREGGSGFTRKGDGGYGTTFLEALQSMEVSDPSMVNYIIVEGGYNDHVTDLQEVKEAVDAFIAEAKSMYPNAKIVIGMNGWNKKDFDVQRKISPLVSVYKQACSENGAYYVSDIEYVGRYASTTFYPDGVHVHPSANRAIAEKTRDYLLKLEEETA